MAPHAVDPAVNEGDPAVKEAGTVTARTKLVADQPGQSAVTGYGGRDEEMSDGMGHKQEGGGHRM